MMDLTPTLAIFSPGIVIPLCFHYFGNHFKNPRLNHQFGNFKCPKIILLLGWANQPFRILPQFKTFDLVFIPH